MTKKFFALTAAALLLVAAPIAQAQGTMKSKPKMMSGKMMGKKMVGYCAKCKMYYSAADTKKMHMMDPMGHKMMMMPMSKVPKDAKMGMAKPMMHDKMMGGGMKKPM